MQEGFVVKWAFAFIGSMGRVVEDQFRSELHRWPLQRSWDATAYEWGQRFLVIVLRDRPAGQFPNVDSRPMKHPALSAEAPSSSDADTDELLTAVAIGLDVRPQDAVLVVPTVGSHITSVEGDWAIWSGWDRNLWHQQVKHWVSRHWYWLKGFDVGGGFMIPPGYEGLAEGCEVFFADHPNFEDNVFLMTRFDDSGYLAALDGQLREVLRSRGLDPVRADDRVYVEDRNLWDNVCVYMLCCSKGVAVLEDRGVNEFNPNVALEYGFMRALNKPTLLLTDIGFRNLRADIIGTLRGNFDLFDVKGTIQPAIERWLHDLGDS